MSKLSPSYQPLPPSDPPEPKPIQKTVWFVYIIFFLLGIGMLFPWNVLITCSQYFKERLLETVYVDNFLNYFSICFMMTNLFMLAYMNYQPGRPLFRILIGLGMNCFVFGICCLLTQYRFGMSGYTFFYLTMICVCLSGWSTALLQNGVFGLVALFPGIYTQSVMSGQGLAGTAVALASMLTLVIGHEREEGENVDFSAGLYFGFSLLVLICCLFMTFLLKNHSFYIQITCKNLTNQEEEETQVLTEETLSEEDVGLPKSRLNDLKPVLPLAISVFMNFFITLSLFPSILNLIHTTQKHSDLLITEVQVSFFQKVLFVPTAFLIFSLFDWIGKSLPGFKDLHLGRLRISFSDYQPTTILIMTLFRVLFIPIFLLSNTHLSQPDQTEHSRNLPLLINNDLLYFFLVSIFAMSNGWLGSLCMMHAPRIYEQRSGGEGKAWVGSMMVFCLTFGLTVGSFFSFFIKSAICSWCDPFNN